MPIQIGWPHGRLTEIVTTLLLNTVWQLDWRFNQTHMNIISLQWRNNELDGVSNHRRFDCLLNRLFRRRPIRTLKLCVTGLCEGNPSVKLNQRIPFTKVQWRGKCFHLMTSSCKWKNGQITLDALHILDFTTEKHMAAWCYTCLSLR